MISEAGIWTRWRYQLLFRMAHTKAAAVSKTSNCPISTPMLKASKEGTKLPSGKPYSPRTAAKPKPCRSPKINTMKGLHLFVCLNTQFSTAIQTIESAMIGSTISPGTCTISRAASANVMVCANVKAVTCQSKDRKIRLEKNNPKTKRI